MSRAGGPTSASQFVRVPSGRSTGTMFACEVATMVCSPTCSNRAKASKFLAFCQDLTLRKLFRLIGYSIGAYPLAYLIAAAIIAAMSGGMYFLKLEHQVRDGYTPATSPSRYEADVLREFSQSVGDPTLTTIALRSRDGGSMHRTAQLDEAVRLHDYLFYNLTATLPHAQQVVYADICGSYCNANSAIKYFHNALLSELSREKMKKNRTKLTNLTYPIARIAGFDIHLEQNFYGVRLNPFGTVQSSENDHINDDEFKQLAAVTNIAHLEVVLMIFRGEIGSLEMEAKLQAWELAVYDFASANFTDSNVEMLVLGTEIVNREMIRDSQKMAPYFAAGFTAMLLFVAATVIGSATFNGVMDPAKLIVAFGATVCPVLAITVTFGVCALASLRTNTIMLIMPFLIMGIGINDAFLMIHSWQRLPKCRVISERLGMVLEEVGPSITITTLTNVITFGIGALTPTPEISLFCMGTAIALGFAYIFTLILFGPILFLATIFERKKHNNSANLMIARLLENGLKFYCRLINNKLTCVLLLCLSLTYWYFGIVGILNIRTRLDVQKLLPTDSPLQEANRVVSNLAWTEYYPVTVLVNKPLNISEEFALEHFEEMVRDFESMHKCRGTQFTLLWLRDYKRYWEEAKLYDFDFYDDEKDQKNISSSSQRKMDYSKVDEFLQSPLYAHWAAFIRRGNSSEVPIQKFWFSVAYHNATSWADRIELMRQWRIIADSYKDLNATVWEANSMFVDQMLSLKTLTLQTGIWTLICMTAVCALFIHNPFSVLTASLTIASISLGVIGYMSWLGLDLDPATLCAILMSIGISVDFTAHVSYHFQLTKRKEIRDNRTVKVILRSSNEKLEHALHSVAWPMTQAGLSTVICVSPLIFLNSYIPLVFVKTISLVVVWGLLHGLVLLPAFLCSVPQKLIEVNCYRVIFSKNSTKGEGDTREPLNEDPDAEYLMEILTEQCTCHREKPEESPG